MTSDIKNTLRFYISKHNDTKVFVASHLVAVFPLDMSIQDCLQLFCKRVGWDYLHYSTNNNRWGTSDGYFDFYRSAKSLPKLMTIILFSEHFCKNRRKGKK